MTHCMKQVHTPTNLLPITVMEEGAAGRGGDSRRRLEEGVGTESATASQSTRHGGSIRAASHHCALDPTTMDPLP